MKLKLFFFLILFTSIHLSAQLNNYNFRNINISDGLSNNNVSSVAQDKFGQVWFGTSNGLNKYNGKEFTVYRNVPRDRNSISNSEISTVLVDREGYVWAGTFNGLNRYDPKTNSFKRYYKRASNKSLSHNLIISSLEMRGGNIWFGTLNGVSIYEKKRNRFIRFLQSNDPNNLRSIYDIYLDKQDNVWLTTNNGIIKVERDENKKFHVKKYKIDEKRSDFYINTIKEIKPGIFGIGSRFDGYWNFDAKTEKFFRPKGVNIPLNIDVRDLEIDDDKNLWIASTNGLFIVSPSNKTNIIKENNIGNFGNIQNLIRKIYKDRNGFIWLCTQNGGIMTWHKSYQNFLHINNSNSYNHITNSIVAGKDNNVYYATEGGVLNVIDKEGNISEIFKINNEEENIDYSIRSIFFCFPDLLFIGTLNKGIIVFDVNTKKVRNNVLSKELINYLENAVIYEIKKDSKDNLYIGAFGKGLVKYNLKTKKLQTYLRPKIATNIVKSIFIDAKDNLVIGGLGGVSIINGLKTDNYLKQSAKTTYNVSCVFKDSNENIWAGTTTRGLFKFDGEKFNKAEILFKDRFSTVNSILEGEKGVLWISTDKGIVKYNSITGKSFTYNQNIIENNNFRQNSGLKVGDQFYFGDLFGITVFNPKKIIKIKDVPKVVLSQLKIKNEIVNINDEHGVLRNSLNYTDVLELNHNNSNFSISYALPNYINTKDNKYAYRLKGLDDTWTFTRQTEAFFTLQTSGKYIFQVKAANHDDVWNKRLANIKIIIHPAPWKTWWAYTFYFIFIFFLFYGLVWVVQSKSRLKNKLELEYIANKKNEELNKAKLQFFTNISHEFRTPLTLILGPLQNILENYKGTNATYKKLRIIESSTNHLLRLINRLMDFRKLESNQFQLEAAEGNIIKFLKEIYLSFSEYAKDKNYSYSFNTTEEEIDVFYDRYKLERVFFNLISNAFRYTKEGGDISLNITKDEDNVIISVKDSGVGISEEYLDKIFDRFFEVAAHKQVEGKYTKGTGIGLSIAKNIVKLHHGDIFVENVKPSGALFTVKLKLGKAHLSSSEIVENFKMSDDVSQYVSQIDVPKLKTDYNIQDLITKEKRYTILIVEDNAILRSFIKEILKVNYNVLEAENGKVALDKAIKNLPDLIVSDVIMPEMVGTELCSKIKTTLATSHIPVILLTSRTSLVYKFEGLESGADDYISKPFNLKEFNLRIRNLLESKQRLKEKFLTNQNFESMDVSLTSLDQKLLEKAFKIVKENISNEDFNIAQFGEELGVSRSMLFTKIKAWSNATPNDFIQEIRLSHAKKLLELDRFTVAEVSFKVGFKRTKYFSQCFKKKYDITPSEYSKKFTGKLES